MPGSCLPTYRRSSGHFWVTLPSENKSFASTPNSPLGITSPRHNTKRRRRPQRDKFQTRKVDICLSSTSSLLSLHTTYILSSANPLPQIKTSNSTIHVLSHLANTIHQTISHTKSSPSYQRRKSIEMATAQKSAYVPWDGKEPKPFKEKWQTYIMCREGYDPVSP